MNTELKTIEETLLALAKKYDKIDDQGRRLLNFPTEELKAQWDSLIDQYHTMKKAIVPILFLALLVGCGKDDPSDPGRDPQSDQKPVIVTEQELQYTSYALTEADLPACDSKRESALAYVDSLQAFRACKSGSWIAVTIKGKDGKDGAAGKDAQVVEQNEWLEGVTGKKWLLGNAGPQMYANSLCSGAYRVPTAQEAVDACYRGIFKIYVAKLGTLPATVGWTSVSTETINSANCQGSSQSTGTPAIILCIQK